jgi:hypothetical protein
LKSFKLCRNCGNEFSAGISEELFCEFCRDLSEEDKKLAIENFLKQEDKMSGERDDDIKSSKELQQDVDVKTPSKRKPYKKRQPKFEAMPTSTLDLDTHSNIRGKDKPHATQAQTDPNVILKAIDLTALYKEDFELVYNGIQVSLKKV